MCLLVSGADSFPDIGLTSWCVVGGVAPVRNSHLIVYKVLFFSSSSIVLHIISNKFFYCSSLIGYQHLPEVSCCCSGLLVTDSSWGNGC